MKKRACISLMALSFLVSILSVAPASAKSIKGLRAQVPFDYQVGDTLIAAGDCTVTSVSSDSPGLIVRGAQGSAVILTSAAQAKANAKSSPRLVFHKYGEQYFLAAVWGAGDMGRRLPESKRERGLRRELQVAGNARMETVTVAAR
jgi:hypothetical protein